MANIRQVAQTAGVSVGSVSDILSGNVRYSYRPETILRVRAAVQRLGYRPNTMARALRQGVTTLVGVVVSADIPPMTNTLMTCVRNELIACGYQPVLLDAAQFDSAHSAGGLPHPGLLAGIISADFALEKGLSEGYARLRKELPLVAVCPVKSRQVDSVTTDRAQAIAMAVEHLASLGHRRVAFAIVHSKSVSQAPKIRGWQQAQRKYPIAPNPLYTIEIPNSVHGMMERAAFVFEALRRMALPPTGVICASDDIALCLLAQLAAAGWKAPARLSVVGFDGVYYGNYSWPPLTTVAQPLREIAREAVQRLKVLIGEYRQGQASVPVQRLIAPELLIRSSTIRCKPESLT